MVRDRLVAEIDKRWIPLQTIIPAAFQVAAPASSLVRSHFEAPGMFCRLACLIIVAERS